LIYPVELKDTIRGSESDYSITFLVVNYCHEIELKVVMLSYASGTSGEGDDFDKVRKATEIVRWKRPDLK
jgi:phosphotransacetylase